MKYYCIYRITNKLNGKTYIGQHRYNNEKDPMRYYKGSGILINQAYAKYGMDNFTKEVLYSRIRDIETANSMEIWMIAKERKAGHSEYNIADGGLGNCPKEGTHLSEETKAKISKANKGRKFPGRINSGCFGQREPWNKGKFGYKQPKDPNKLGKHWFNNGKIQLMARECPEGFTKGRLNFDWLTRDEFGRFIRK